MKEFTKTITVYDFDDTFEGFYVEAHKEDDAIDLYLSHKSYCDKMYMFGVLSDADNSAVREVITNNIEEYINIYKDEYMDIDD